MSNNRRRTYNAGGGNNIGIVADFTIRIDRNSSDPAAVTVEGDPTPLLNGFRRCLAYISTEGDLDPESIFYSDYIETGSTETMDRVTSSVNAKICFLNDNDSNYYEDGTLACLDGSEGNVMVYFPEFWYLGETTETEHILKVSTDKNKSNEGWNYSKSNLLSAYITSYSTTDYTVGTGTYREVSGVASSVSGKYTTLDDSSLRVSIYEFENAIKKLGYKHVWILYWMFLAKYKTRNISSILSENSTDLFMMKTGSTNSIGMKDVTQEDINNNPNLASNFLGVEGILMDGKAVDYENSDLGYLSRDYDTNNPIIRINFPDNALNREINPYLRLSTYTSYNVEDIIGGSYMDILPKTMIGEYNSYYDDKYYCSSYSNYYSTSDGVSYGAGYSGKLINFSSYHDNTNDNSGNYVTRKSFNGDIEIINSTNEYKNLVNKKDFLFSCFIFEYGRSYSMNTPLWDREYSINLNWLSNLNDNMTLPNNFNKQFRRCLCKKVKDNHVKICYLNRTDSNYYHDGTPAKLDGTEGDVMVYIPEYWDQYINNIRIYHRYEVTEDGYIFSSKNLKNDNLEIPIPDFNHHPASLVSAYRACNVSNKLYSKSGVAPISSYINTLRTYASNRGKGYHIIDYDQVNTLYWASMFSGLRKNMESNTGDYWGEYMYDDTYTITGLNNEDINTFDYRVLNKYKRCFNILGIEGLNFSFILEGGHGYRDSSNGEYYLAIYDKGYYPNYSFDDIPYERKRSRGQWNRSYYATYAFSMNQYKDILCGGTRYHDDEGMYYDKYVIGGQYYEGVGGLVKGYGSNPDNRSSLGCIGAGNVSNHTYLAFDGTIEVVDDVEEFKALPVL